MALVLTTIRAADANGAAYPGAKLFLYEAGEGEIPQGGFKDAAGNVQHANPVVCDANGTEAVWLDDTKNYKVVLKDAAEARTLFFEPNYDPSAGPLLVWPFASNVTTEDASYSNPDLPNATTRTINSVLKDFPSINDYLPAEPTEPNATEVTAAFQSIADEVGDLGGGMVQIPRGRMDYQGQPAWLLNDTITISRPGVILQGVGKAFKGLFSPEPNRLPRFGGTAIVLEPGTDLGTDADTSEVAPLFKVDLDTSLIDANAAAGVRPRIHSGLENLTLYGARYDDSATSAGGGVLVNGTMYSIVRQCSIVGMSAYGIMSTSRRTEAGALSSAPANPVLGQYAQSDGTVDGTFGDDGAGMYWYNGSEWLPVPGSANNAEWWDLVVQSCGGNGIDITSPDSIIGRLQLGFNRNNLRIGGGGNLGVYGVHAWDSTEDNIRVSGGPGVKIYGHAYDASDANIAILSGDADVDLMLRDANRDKAVGTPRTTSNIYVGGTASATIKAHCRPPASGAQSSDPARTYNWTEYDLYLADGATANVAQLKASGGSNIISRVGFENESNSFYSENAQNYRQLATLNSSSLFVGSSSVPVFDASEEGAVWDVVVAHSSGSTAVTGRILGDTVTPRIISQSTDGVVDLLLSIQGTFVRVQNNTNATGYTCTASVYRVH